VIWFLLYFIFAAIFSINLFIGTKILEYVRQAVSVKERPKLVEKIAFVKNLQKYCIVWPYVCYKLIIKK
jgi:hypothetical protein